MALTVTNLHTVSGWDVPDKFVRLAWEVNFCVHGSTFETTIQRKPSGGAYATIYTYVGEFKLAVHTMYDDIVPLHNIKYYYRVRIHCDGAHHYSPYSNEVSFTWAADTVLAGGPPLAPQYRGICLSENISEYAINRQTTFQEPIHLTEILDEHAIFADTITADIINLTEWVGSFQSIRVNHTYFLGDSDGYLYEYHKDYKSDDGKAITAYYQTKKLDFADQYPKYGDWFKTIYAIHLIYVDKGATSFTVYLSNDGGVSWESQTKAVGNGDGVTKREFFYFIKTGQFFNIKVEQASSSKSFQWIRIAIEFEPSSEYCDYAP